MPSIDAAASIYTQVLVDALVHMNGRAKEAVTVILLSSLRVANVPMLTSRETAELFTKWYNEGVLNEKLICIQPRAVYAAVAKAKIEDHLRDLDANFHEENASLRAMHLWVTNPILYMERMGI